MVEGRRRHGDAGLSPGGGTGAHGLVAGRRTRSRDVESGAATDFSRS